MNTISYPVIPIIPKSSEVFNSRYTSNKLSLEIAPLTKCNLNCSFCCYGDVTPKSNITTEKVQHIKDVITKVSKKMAKVEGVNATIAGGEIFADFVKSIDWLYELTDHIINTWDDKDVELSIAVTSNLINHRIEEVIEYLQKYRNVVKFHTSFDFLDRFKTPRVLEIFENNLNKIVKAGIPVVVGIVVTRPMIDIVNGNISEYSEINKALLKSYYNIIANHSIVFQIYENYRNIDQYVVTDQQYAEFIVDFIDQYPSSKFAKQFKVSYNSNNLPINYNQNKCTRYNVTVNNLYENKDITTSTACCDLQKSFAKLTHTKSCMLCNYASVCHIGCPNSLDSSNFCMHQYFYEKYTN